MLNPAFSTTINLLGSDEPCLDPDKLTELALDIGEVIRKYGATDHVRERVIRWVEERAAWRAEQFEFERRRDEYGEKIHNAPKLQDESVPPDSNCVFEYVSWRRGVDGKQHLLRKYGWVPRELSSANFPEPSYPLPMSSGKATLNEKYAALAAIFDAGSKGVEKIDPYGDYPEIVKVDERKWYVRWLARYDSRPRKTFETKAEAEAFAASPFRGLPKTVQVEDLEEVIAWDVGSSVYRELVACVVQLPRSDEGHLLVWLRDVEDDLQGIDKPDSVKQPDSEEWTVPEGYISASDIMNDLQFAKNGKQPKRTTIQSWEEKSKRKGNLVKKIKAPDTQECHYPKAWAMEQRALWNPRQ